MNAPHADLPPFVGAASSDNPENPVKEIDPAQRHERAGYWLLTLPELVGWYSKRVYTGHTLKKKADHWLLIIRARKGVRKQVSFHTGASPVDTVRVAAWSLASGQFGWKDDLY